MLEGIAQRANRSLAVLHAGARIGLARRWDWFDFSSPGCQQFSIPALTRDKRLLPQVGVRSFRKSRRHRRRRLAGLVRLAASDSALPGTSRVNYGFRVRRWSGSSNWSRMIFVQAIDDAGARSYSAASSLRNIISYIRTMSFFLVRIADRSEEHYLFVRSGIRPGYLRS